MTHELPPLPYSVDALAPYISEETLTFHHGKHHQSYVTNLNKLIVDSEFNAQTLEEIIQNAPAGSIFNNAAQIWNHTFYWHSLSPNGGGEPTGALLEAMNASFGGFAAFKEAFTQTALSTFGSGWVWLVKNQEGGLELVRTSNAGNPLTDHKTPLFTCDVWEHAYYIDYRNARPQYLEAFWALVHWEFAEKNLRL